MKYLYVFFLLTFTGIQASDYECAGMGIQVFPEQKEISLHPMFIIEGYALSQKHIEALRDRHIYLETAAGEKVPLELQEILKGQMYLTQAIFKPAGSLSPHNKYYLKLEPLPGDDRISQFNQKYNREKKEYETIYWETTNLEYSPPLNTNLKIEFVDTSVEFYGCGPAANAVFEISGKGNAQIWYKTEMHDLTTGRRSTYYIREWNDQLRVGHGMCSGAFIFSKDGKYRVRFTPLNPDGKELNTTSWITFDSPFKNAGNPYGF